MKREMKVVAVLGVLGWAVAGASGQCQPTWSAVPGRPPATVRAMTVHDFDGVGPEPARLIVTQGSDLGLVWSFDGRVWRRLGGTFSGPPRVLYSHDQDGPGPVAPELYAAGLFVRDQGTAAETVIRWSGSDWSTVPGLADTVKVMCTHDPDGEGPAPAALFAMTGSTTATRIYTKTPTGWSVVGMTLAWTTSGAGALASFDADGPGPGLPALYFGGDFTSVSGVPARGIARWNGTSWAEVGGGISDSAFGTPYVGNLAVFDADGAGPARAELVVGGSFRRAGSVVVSGGATWDGSRWMGTGGSGAYGSDITTISAAVSGAGPQVIICGEITPPRMVMSWDGASWSALGPGIDDPVWAVQEFDEDGPGPKRPRLYAGGEFGRVHGMGLETGKLASWGCPDSICRADMNGDGVVDFGDYLEFLNLYEARDPRADLSGDGVVDFGDYLEFLNAFDAGC